jgi:ribosomal protein S18 acetylase RimI-like enzyme
MEITIREWTQADLLQIRIAWLDYCRKVARPDMRLRADADSAMRQWLAVRFKQPYSRGFVAERDAAVVGFLIARIDDWDSSPPLIEPRRIGIIDAVYVSEQFRQQGVGTRLIDRAIQAMRDADAVAVETIYDACNEASTETWQRAGFAPWMVQAYKML